MRHTVNKKTIALTAAAVTLAAGLQVGNAYSYFTAYNTASGSARIELGTPGPVPEEDFDNWIKTVTVVNNSADTPCYVRLRVVAGDLYAADMTYVYDDAQWEVRDGYYYYRNILQPGERAGEFKIHIPAPAADAKDFNVIVVEDHTPVVYDEEGNPYADWNLKAVPADSGQELNQDQNQDQNQGQDQSQNQDQNPNQGQGQNPGSGAGTGEEVDE